MLKFDKKSEIILLRLGLIKIQERWRLCSSSVLTFNLAQTSHCSSVYIAELEQAFADRLFLV